MQTGLGLRSGLRVLGAAVALSQVGCGGAIALWLGLGGSDSSGGGSSPVVVDVREPSFGATPDEILVRFSITGGNGGQVSALVQFVEVENERALGLPRVANAMAESAPKEALQGDVTHTFRWDAGRDLDDGSAHVKLFLTPMEDGRAGQTVETSSFRAGNTPAEIRDLVLLSQGDELTAFFKMVDLESDAVDVVDIDVQVAGGEWLSLPEEVLETLPENTRLDFSSSKEGTPGTLPLSLGKLDRPDGPPALRGSSKRGFVGSIGLRLQVQDFDGEPMLWSDDAQIPINTTAPPRLQFLPVPEWAGDSGIVPLRFRVFETGKSPRLVDVHIEFDLGDGKDARQALEFPARNSSGQRVLSLSAGSKDTDFHTFYWDVATQLRGRAQEATIRVRAWASDVGVGLPDSDAFQFSRPGLTGIGRLTLPDEVCQKNRRGEIVSCVGGKTLVRGDYNGDGFQDLLVLGSCEGTRDGNVVFFLGSFDGLRDSGVVLPDLLGSGETKGPPRSGDFDQDGYDDVLYGVKCPPGRLTLLKGGKDGLRWADTFELEGDFEDATPASIEVGRFQDLKDDLPGLLVTVPLAHSLLLFRVEGDTLQLEEHIDFRTIDEFNNVSPDLEPTSMTSADFDNDGYSDVVVTDREGTVSRAAGPKIVYFFAGSSGGLFRARFSEDVTSSVQRPFSGYFDGNDETLDVAIPSLNGNTITIFSGGAFPPVYWKSFVAFGTRPWAGIGVDVNQDGYEDLVAINRGPNGIGSGGVLSFFPGTAGGITDLREDWSTGVLADPDFGSSDWNADGFPDFLVANNGNPARPELESRACTAFFGGVDGVFQGEEIPTDRNPRFVLSGDFDADGVPEAVVANTGENYVSYLGVPTGGLEFLSSYSKITSEPRELLAADLDRDGFQDLVVRADLELFYFPERGSDLAESIRLPSQDATRAAVIGDFTGDDLPEIVVAQRNIKVLQLGAGGLDLVGEPIEVGETPFALATGDFLGADGRPEIVVANEGSQFVTVLGRGPDGTLSALDKVSLGKEPEALLAGDFNGDHRLDLVVAVSDGPGAYSLLFLAGDGRGFAEPVPATGGAGSFRAWISGDFDGDGFLDIVALERSPANVSVYRGGAEGLSYSRLIAVGGSAQALTSGDYDGDGFPDVAVAVTGSVRLFPGSPTGLAASGTRFSSGTLARLVSADLDGDGFLDLAGTDRAQNRLAILSGSPAGFRAADFLAVEGANPEPLLAVELTGDGFVDLAVANNGTAISPATSVSIFQQRYFSPHSSVLIDPASEAPPVLEDVRTPPRYQLELPAEAFDSPTPVSVILTTAFELPQGAAHARGNYLTVVTQPVKILRTTTELETPARLALLLRDKFPFEEDTFAARVRNEPERLRVTRLDEETGRGVELAISPKDIESVLLGDATGVAFRINRFGSYLVAFERDR